MKCNSWLPITRKNPHKTHNTCPRIVIVLKKTHNYDPMPSVSPLGHPPSLPVIYPPLDIHRLDTIAPRGRINLKTPSTNHSNHQDFIMAIRSATPINKKLDSAELFIRPAKRDAQCSPYSGGMPREKPTSDENEESGQPCSVTTPILYLNPSTHSHLIIAILWNPLHKAIC